MHKGAIASKGYAIGKALCLVKKQREIPKTKITNVQEAITQFEDAIRKSINAVQAIQDKLEGHHAIFQAHLEMIRDPEIKTRTEKIIKDEKLHPAYAYKVVTDEFIDVFDLMENDYFKERASDIKDIQHRVLTYLLNEEEEPDVDYLDDTIIFTDDLTPSDTAKLDLNKVVGVVTERGGITSHSAIMAQAFDLPALVGVGDIMKKVKTGDTVIVDAVEGNVKLKPTESELVAANVRVLTHNKRLEALKHYIDKESITQDGHKIALYANVGNPIELETIAKSGAEGIGLFRTEFLFIDRDTMPTETEQIKDYKKVFDMFDDVTVRTFDIGADKELLYLKTNHELNPALGERGIRLYFKEPAMFKTQIRALLKAAKDKKSLKIMFPMVSHLNEIIQAKKLIDEVIESLINDNIPHQKNLIIGIMIEVPSAALNARELGEYVDFFSVGTNDLIQYLYGADRTNDSLTYLNKPYDPSFIKLIKHVVDAAKATNTAISVCGELAGELDMAPLFVGLGIDTLSMAMNRILPVRELINNIEYTTICEITEKILLTKSDVEIQSILKTKFK